MKIVGQESSHGLENTSCNKSRACRKGQTGEEETKQQKMKIMKEMTRKIKRNEEWMRTTVGGSVICWPLTVSKRSSMKVGKMLCRDGMIGCRRMTQRKNGQSNDQKFRGKCRDLAESHQANGVERRIADSEG